MSGLELERLLDPVFDDDDPVARIGQPSQQLEQASRRRRIEVRQWLVHDVEPRLHHEDPGGRDELPLAARQCGGLPVEECPDPGVVEDPAEPCPDLFPRQPEVLRPERELGLDGSPDDLLGRILEDGPDRLGDLAQPLFGRGTAGHADRAGELAGIGMGNETVDRPDQRALATAGRPGDEQDLARRDRQRQVDDRRFARSAVAERQPLDLDEGRLHQTQPGVIRTR